MNKRILWLLVMLPHFALCQYCENFNTYTKADLEGMGWATTPNNGWSISKNGAYSSKSAFVSAGIGNVTNLVTGCATANSSTETLSFVYTFSSGSGTLRIGIQDGFGSPATGVIWLDTLAVVNTWTSYSLSFTPAFNPYKIVTYIGNTNASAKIGIDNFCLASSNFIGTCVFLPIELNSFSAQLENNSIARSTSQVKLSWETESEKNSKSFGILRSGDGVNFDSIGVISASGTSYTPLSYSYEDNVAGAGQLYYRLKSIDNDGIYSFSKIISVALSNSNQQPWFVSDGIFHYSGTENDQVVIYSAQGQMVYNKILFSNLNESLNFLSPGIYFVKLTNSFSAMKSFVIF